MDERTFRIATRLEVRHYRELLQPINDFLAAKNAQRDDMPVELIEITQAVFGELDRFGYVPTQDALLVGVDRADSRFDAPELDPRQAAAAHLDVEALFARLRRH
ncbi:hypothetical protein [Massilia sp. DWR3-1-1]|uniref:hypothetical protein n=1 Tax=Massilia sp. DWR3-1-1 TaxID=2804559 RepID=UPI003CEB8A51